MTRFDILFIVGLTISLIIFNEAGLTEKAAPYIFLPLFLCYLCGRAVGARIARNQETEIAE